MPSFCLVNIVLFCGVHTSKLLCVMLMHQHAFTRLCWKELLTQLPAVLMKSDTKLSGNLEGLAVLFFLQTSALKQRYSHSRSVLGDQMTKRMMATMKLIILMKQHILKEESSGAVQIGATY